MPQAPRKGCVEPRDQPCEAKGPALLPEGVWAADVHVPLRRQAQVVWEAVQGLHMNYAEVEISEGGKVQQRAPLSSDAGQHTPAFQWRFGMRSRGCCWVPGACRCPVHALVLLGSTADAVDPADSISPCPVHGAAISPSLAAWGLPPSEPPFAFPLRFFICRCVKPILNRYTNPGPISLDSTIRRQRAETPVVVPALYPVGRSPVELSDAGPGQQLDGAMLIHSPCYRTHT